MKKIFKKNKGFTLIELLAMMVVLGVIGGVVAGILFSSLRATNKTNTLTTIRQNGNYAVSQVSKMIKNAKSFEGVRINLTPVSPTPELESSCTNTSTTYHVLKITTFDESSPNVTFTCDVGSLTINGTSLVDESAVRVVNCNFICFQSSASDFPTVEMDLILSQKDENALFEKRATIEFRTSATMRNLNK